MIRKQRQILQLNKAVILELVILILFAFISVVNAATLTWTGGGTDNLASNPANWSGGIAPQDGDDVVFDSTSSKDCTWDLNVTLVSLIKYSGYTGEIIKTSGTSLTVARVVTWTNGAGDNRASNINNWSTYSLPKNGDKVVFNDTSSDNCIWDIGSSPDLFSISSDYTGTITLDNGLIVNGNLTIAGGILDLNDKNLNVEGYVFIGPDGTLNATSSTIEVKGDWANAGTFIPGTSTVILSGTNQTIYGNTTFYNLIKTVTSADTLYFQAGSTQTIINSLTLQGADSSNLLALRSTVDGQQWFIDPQGTRNISFASIKDMNNIDFINIVPISSEDAGNNEGVSFGGDECVCFRSLSLQAKAPLPVIASPDLSGRSNLVFSHRADTDKVIQLKRSL